MLGLFTLAVQQQAQSVSTPASVVASEVRNALANPGEPMNWATLEESVEQLEAVTPDPAAWEATLEAVLFRVSDLIEAFGPQALFLAAGVTVGVVTARLVVKHLRRTRPQAARTEVTREVTVTDNVRGRGWTASVLSEQGLSNVEIARRTGMARDAVDLALTREQSGRSVA